MRVKRLEIQGFKSFKDKTVIHFDDGVTGIVGPNGCGKSNIVDSFFWVMGEQSNKHMRADGSQDLIFNGSEKYAPLGMAEVTMVLSTGATGATLPEGTSLRDLPPHMRYEEISISRRVYRDGESGYLINGQQCRLKDIHELFMDTGAGPKAYSIIEQGQISKIVASKPEDRRVLVEEAAGIVKFKARKKESLRKIEATRQNLLRINDIVAEIERQLGFLERQATKARQYRKYKEELQGKEMLVSRKKLHNLKIRTNEVVIRLRELEVGEVESRNALQTAELRIENLKIQITEAQRLAEDSQLSLQTLQREISQDDTKVQLHRRNIQELVNSNTTLEEENEDLSANIARLAEDQAKLEEEARQLAEMFANADTVLKEHQTRLDEAKATADQMGRALEQDKRELMSSLNRQTEISNQVHGLEARVDSLSVQVNGLTTKIADRELDCEILTEKSTTARAAYELHSDEATVSRERSEKLKVETQSLETQLKQLRIDSSAAREDRAKTDSKVKALQQLVDNHEGFRADVCAILKDSTLSSALRGAFADRLEAHPGYEYALEGVLREFLDNLFVDNSTSAKALIDALKEGNIGRATFWSMDLVDARASAKAVAGPSAELTAVTTLAPGARPLRDVIRLTHEKADAVLGLFDHYFVVDSLDEALDAFTKTAHAGTSFVTREGDMVDRYGRVSGGSTKSLEGGILARKAELQKLTEHLAAVTIRSEELGAQLVQVETTLQTQRLELEQVTARLRDLDLQAKSAERDLVSADHQLSTARAQLDSQRAEREMLDTERKDLWTKLDAIRQELTGIETGTRERELFIEEKSRGHNEAVQQASELQGTMIQLKVDFAAANEKFRHARQNLERIEGELVEDRARKEEVESLVNHKLDEKDMVAQELVVLEENLREMTERAQLLEDTTRERKNRLELVNGQLNEAFDQQRFSMKAVEEGSSELNRLRVENERGTLEYSMLYQSLFEKYGIEESAIPPQNEEDQRAFDELTSERESELQGEVDRLRERIRKLGEVNLMAVEEYDEQKKRHDFLITQREDLNKSILDLERAIERINKTSEERFKIAFEEINTRFQRIFPIVFGGGWGKLTLTNPEDMNETGVDIIAEPPGKKVGSIQLMSGGEKALTAVALIFSIFLIKPSPFCVLDEVDAPLDDHNVGKFNALLKEMAVRSQFIIITHNKRTMELNDKLYGVTMEEPGVSKMVSIQIQ
ncbi:MAG: chromosome segregation protein SMC [Deltaproteobacteria bacterium]|nr:chromosome segregation protein SMC [Deltaproteobacteria bacterium]